MAFCKKNRNPGFSSASRAAVSLSWIDPKGTWLSRLEKVFREAGAGSPAPHPFSISALLTHPESSPRKQPWETGPILFSIMQRKSKICGLGEPIPASQPPLGRWSQAEGGELGLPQSVSSVVGASHPNCIVP